VAALAVDNGLIEVRAHIGLVMFNASQRPFHFEVTRYEESASERLRQREPDGPLLDDDNTSVRP
jgi:hypothetical protein